MKKVAITDISNQIIRDFYSKGFSEERILFEVKAMIPKNTIEKRILQRVACLIGGFLKIKKGEFKNIKIEYLLSCLRNNGKTDKE